MKKRVVTDEMLTLVRRAMEPTYDIVSNRYRTPTNNELRAVLDAALNPDRRKGERRAGPAKATKVSLTPRGENSSFPPLAEPETPVSEGMKEAAMDARREYGHGTLSGEYFSYIYRAMEAQRRKERPGYRYARCLDDMRREICGLGPACCMNEHPAPIRTHRRATDK